MREVQEQPSDLLDRAREAFLAHCGSWGGFDNADDARRCELRLELKRYTPPTKARTVRTETRPVPRFEE